MRLPRYLALAGRFDPFAFRRHIGPLLEEAGLTRVFSGPILHIYSDGPSPILLPGDSGLVLGPIFRRDGDMETIARFDEAQAREIAASRGQELIERCWGDYVAFVADGDNVAVTRPPLSDLGCLHAEYRGLRLVASDLELLARCGVSVETPNWTEIARHLRMAGLRRDATCIAGIDELLWGNRLIVSDDAPRIEPCWTPWRFALAPRDGCQNELAHALRDVTLKCVHAQVRHIDSIVAMLSGGLDSSILTACLATAGVRLHCLNLSFGDANGDERIYARAVAARVGIPLIEARPEIADVDITKCAAPWLARPINRAFLQSLHIAKERITAATAAVDVVDGGGGDSVFCSMHSAAPVADRLLREGLSHGVFKTAADVARLNDASLAQVLALALRRAFLRRRGHRWQGDTLFLSEEAAARAGKPMHPWLKAPRGAVPGSASHIANMIVVENLIEIGNGSVAEWSPLMAQPLVEFCLSVPAWHWFDNGHNRALARHAFEKLLPTEVAWRRDKGTPDGFVAAIFDANRERLAEMLIGGRLDEAGLLDRAAIEASLAKTGPVRGHDYTRLLRIADVEAWVRARGDTRSVSTHASAPATDSDVANAIPNGHAGA